MTEQGTPENVMKYVLNNNLGEIKKKGNKELKTVRIDGKNYRYNKDKPIINRLKTKLNKIANTNEYKRHLILQKSKTRKAREALKRYAIRQKAVISNEAKALKSYANTYSISNINLQGWRGLSYFKHQKERLLEYIRKNKSMKILADVEIEFEKPNDEEEDNVILTIRSRRCNILNEDDLNKALDNMAHDIEVLVEQKQLNRSGLSIKKIHKIWIHYDRYDPTRAGQYIPLPRWIALKKACINVKNYDNLCFKYCVFCRFYEIYKKDNPERLYRYTKVMDENIINWGGIEFQHQMTT